LPIVGFVFFDRPNHRSTEVQGVWSNFFKTIAPGCNHFALIVWDEAAMVKQHRLLIPIKDCGDHTYDPFGEVTNGNQNKWPFQLHKGGSYNPDRAWERIVK
jgi:hypothetical protein